MSLPDVLTVDKNGVFYMCLWIPDPVRAKCGLCGRGAIYYSAPRLKQCRVCKNKLVYAYPSIWHGAKL